MIRNHRRAFSLFDLLIVIAILGLLLALLLPAVAKARFAASRAMSQNHLKQIALGCHNYHDVHNALPPGYGKNNFSTAAYLLPYIEEQALFQKLDFTQPISAKGNSFVAAVTIKVFVSPLDPVQRVSDDYGPTNYLFNAGSRAGLARNDGIFYLDSKTKFADVVDGTSNTLFTGETLKGDGGAKAVDVHRQHVALGEKELKDLTEDSGVKDFKDDKNIAGDRCARWIDGSFLQGTFNGTRPANDDKPDVSCAGMGGLSALRSLDGNVNIALCDGSVRTVAANATPKLWKLLSSRNDGQALPNDF